MRKVVIIHKLIHKQYHTLLESRLSKVKRMSNYIMSLNIRGQMTNHEPHVFLSNV
jgi:hypothetical protein